MTDSPTSQLQKRPPPPWQCSNANRRLETPRRSLQWSAVTEYLFHFVTDESWTTHLAVFFVVGIFVGSLLANYCAHWSQSPTLWITAHCRQCGHHRHFVERLPLFGYLFYRRCPHCDNRAGWGTFLTELVTGLCFPALVIAVIHTTAQNLDEEGLTRLLWVHWRILFQLTLVSLLIAATAIDFEQYLIPDRITVTGMAIGTVGATAINYLYIVPVWIDWNDFVPRLRDPFIPTWIFEHPHWHGLVWSVTGLIVGGGITWLVRYAAEVMLGYESLGFGDVTLMAMIGSFIGWQAVLLVFLLAPLIGILAIPLILILRGRVAVPYGPFLSLATFVVLIGWKRLWKPTQLMFGHAESLLMIGGAIVVTFFALLGGLRLYRAIPVRRK